MSKLLELVEYGKSVRCRKNELPLEYIRQESLNWKSILGLRELPISVEYAGPDTFALRTQGVTGVLQIGDCTVEIQPKFLEDNSSAPWKQALFHILTIIDSPSSSSASPLVGITEEDTLPDLLGNALLSSMNIARTEGFMRGYMEVEGTLPVMRGRFDANKFAPFLLNPYQIPCIYDEFSENIALNRLLRWAAYQLADMVRSSYLSYELIEVADALSEVSRQPPGLTEAEGFVLPVQYSYLQPALDAARLLLRQQSLYYQQGQEGTMEGISFLWKSFDVFERFVRHLLSLVCTGTNDWFLEQAELILAVDADRGQGAIRTIPDYRIRKSRKTVLILDAKYKTWTKKRTPDVSNVYQVMAAGRLEECSNVCLIYPYSQYAPSKPRVWKIQGKGTPVLVHALFVDLIAMALPGGEKQLVNKLKSDIEVVLSSAF